MCHHRGFQQFVNGAPPPFGADCSSCLSLQLRSFPDHIRPHFVCKPGTPVAERHPLSVQTIVAALALQLLSVPDMYSAGLSCTSPALLLLSATPLSMQTL